MTSYEQWSVSQVQFSSCGKVKTQNREEEKIYIKMERWRKKTKLVRDPIKRKGLHDDVEGNDGDLYQFKFR